MQSSVGRNADLRRKPRAIFTVECPPAAAAVVAQNSADSVPVLVVVGRRVAGRRAETRRQQLRLAARINGTSMGQPGVEASAAGQRQLIVRTLYRDVAGGVIDVLMQGGDTHLSVVDQIHRYFLHDAQSQRSSSERQMRANLEHAIALGRRSNCAIAGCSGRSSKCAAAGETFSSENGVKNRPK